MAVYSRIVFQDAASYLADRVSGSNAGRCDVKHARWNNSMSAVEQESECKHRMHPLHLCTRADAGYRADE